MEARLSKRPEVLNTGPICANKVLACLKLSVRMFYFRPELLVRRPTIARTAASWCPLRLWKSTPL